MHKLLIISLLTFPLLAHSDTVTINVTALCDNTGGIAKELQQTYGETPVLIGKIGSPDATMSLLVNGSTGSWTIVAIKGDVVCVYLTGTGVQVLPTTRPKSGPKL
jgi:uncharacterized membrane protein (DUF441 family)